MLSRYSGVFAGICYIADRATRQELAAGGSISGERDYMSALSTRIRDSWRAIRLPALLHSATVDGSVEQAFGVDTAIIVSDGHIAKLCLIEAKWPRVFTKPAHPWDKVPSPSPANPSPISHLSSQLSRQKRALPQALVIEMFINETVPGTPSILWDQYGASCVSHESACAYEASYRAIGSPWENHDLWNLLGSVNAEPKSVYHYILELTECRLGIPLAVVGGKISISAGDDAREIIVPVTQEIFERQAAEAAGAIGVRNLLVLGVPLLG